MTEAMLTIVGVAAMGAVTGVFVAGFRWGWKKERTRQMEWLKGKYQCPKCKLSMSSSTWDSLMEQQNRGILGANPGPGGIIFCCSTPGCFTPIKDYIQVFKPINRKALCQSKSKEQ